MPSTSVTQASFFLLPFERRLFTFAFFRPSGRHPPRFPEVWLPRSLSDRQLLPQHSQKLSKLSCLDLERKKSQLVFEESLLSSLHSVWSSSYSSLPQASFVAIELVLSPLFCLSTQMRTIPFAVRSSFSSPSTFSGLCHTQHSVVEVYIHHTRNGGLTGWGSRAHSVLSLIPHLLQEGFLLYCPPLASSAV